MSWIGKVTVASVATMIFVLSIALPLSGAQGADTWPPNTTATVTGTPGDNGWYKSTAPEVTLTAVDNGTSGVANIFYRFDNDNYIPYTSSFTVPDGEHTLVFYSVDNAGNEEPISYTDNYIQFKVDTSAPVMNLTIKGNLSTTGYYNGTTTANLTVSDNCSGVSYVQYSYDNLIWTNYTGNVTIPDGDNVLYYRCNDTAGNVNQSSENIKVFDPVVGVSPAASAWYANYFVVSFILPDSVDHVNWSLDRKTWYQNPAQIYLSWEGNTTIYYRAYGKSGDVSDIRRVWYGVDITGPTIGIRIDGSQSSSGWYNGDITVHLDAKDNGSISLTEWSLDGSHWNKYDKPFRMASQKSKTIYYRTFDMFNRSASGEHFLYFAPGGYDQGSMSNSVWIDGVLYGPSTGEGPSPTATPSMTPTVTAVPEPSPTPTAEPSPTPEAPASSSPLAIGVILAVLALVVVAGVAAYLFLLKPK